MNANDLLDLIRFESCFEVRLAVSRIDNKLSLESFVAVPTMSQENHNTELYDYGKCLFTNVNLSSEEMINGLSVILDKREIPTILSGLDCSIFCDSFLTNTEFQHQHVFSRFSWGPYPMFDFPYDLYRLFAYNNRNFNWHEGPVNAKGLPFFHSFAQAAHHFLYGSQIPTNVGQPSHFDILIFEKRARIQSVIQGEKSLRVLLEGIDIKNCEVKLLGRDPDIINVWQANEAINRDIPLPIRPKELTIVLTHDDKVLDMRTPIHYLRLPFTEHDADENLEPEPIESFIAWQGESLTVEYKSEWSKEVAKSIVGFANAEGGSVFFGIKDDVEGIRVTGIDNIDDLKNAINNIIERTSGYFGHRMEVHKIQEKQILRLIVEESKEKPVAFVESGEHRFYIRRDGSTRRVRREDILNWKNTQVPAFADPYINLLN